jgi:hypothetical protein
MLVVTSSAVGVLGTSACGGAPAPPAATVSFRLRGTPPNATVTIDDQPIGPLEMVQQRGIALPPGPHRITVEAPDYLPWDRIVTAAPGDRPIAMQVELVRVPE